jgi:dCTP deaminase
MAVLSDQEIWNLIASDRLRIEPIPDPDSVSPSAIDLRLARKFTRLKTLSPAIDQGIDTRESKAIMDAIADLSETEEVADGNFFRLEPQHFVLAWTLESITLPNFLCARVEGRSTLARLGLSIHQSAPTVHATFSNPLQLELFNAGPLPLKLYPGEKICQLVVETLSLPSTTALHSIHTRPPISQP